MPPWRTIWGRVCDGPNGAYAVWKVSVWPSTAMAWPDTILPAGDARNRHMSAISLASTKRLIDWPLVYSARTASGVAPRIAASALITRVMRSPSTEPGQIAFTRTFQGPSSAASDLVRPMTAHLAAAYGVRSG
jgi:hypothetical protein